MLLHSRRDDYLLLLSICCSSSDSKDSRRILNSLPKDILRVLRIPIRWLWPRGCKMISSQMWPLAVVTALWHYLLLLLVWVWGTNPRIPHIEIPKNLRERSQSGHFDRPQDPPLNWLLSKCCFSHLSCWINPTIPRHSIPWQKVDIETPFNLRVRSQSRPLWPVRTRWLPPVASQRGGGRDAKSNLHFWPKKISTKKWPKNDPK